ncbi:MAG: UvrD-helicase domain-containing protein, partial [Pseudomonadota bacterium]
MEDGFFMYLNIVKYNKWMNDLKSIILQANAGSGKTTAIVNRVVQLLLIENNWQKILCITFTKAAAYEMENRILDYLFYLKNTAADNEIIEKFKKFIFFASNDIFSNNSDQKKQYNNNFVNNSSLYKRVKSKRIIKRILYIRELFDKYVYNKVRIYTIHAFAQYVLQNLLVLPVFDIIDDLGMKKICYNIFNDIAIEFSQFFQGFSNGLEIIEYIIYNIDLFEHEIDLSDFKLKIASDSQIESYHMQILEIKNQINHEKLNVYNSIYDVYKIKNIFLTLNNRPRKTMIINLNSEQQKIIQESILIVYNYLESKKCMKDTAMLNKLGQRVRQKFISYKNTQSKLTFDDLIKKVVENRDIIDGYLHAGINHVLIDESQDTSVVQWQLIDILVQNYLFDIHKTIFIVGDSKQLIYSFQNANIVFFQNYLNRVYELSCENNRPIELINLNNNYRSGKAIIEFVNMFFDHSICVNDQYSSRVELWPIMSKKSISSKINSVNVKQGSVNCNKYLDDDGPFAELNVNLYDEICDYIFKLVQDENKDYKDIMVLFRNRSQNMHNLIETMNKKGIPNSGHDKMCIKDHMIVKLLIVIAKFVLLPYDDYNLVELLKSRLFNLNDAQIYYIKSCIVSDVDSSIDDNIDDQHCLQKTIWFVLSNRKEFVDIFKVLNCFLLNVDMDLSSFFYNVIYRNNLINLFQYLDSCNTVEFFLDIVNKYLLSYDNSLYSFVDWFSDNEFIYKKDNINVDYVLISTVHGVKGMESSVVIIADSTRVYINSNALIKDANNNVFIKNSNSDYIRNIISNSKSDEEEESQRLLYVAMTRAKDILIIAGSGKVMNGSWYHYLYDMVSNRFSIMNRKNYKYFVLEYEGMDRYGKNAD